MWPASCSTNISSFYYSDINLFLIGYACCKIYNIRLLLFESNAGVITIQELHTREKVLLQLLFKIG